ncbi:hypothetical protein CAC42_3188 [Sphaceloma murrayae]|uniref:Uncharacterized protein n=1 Tax=Sphaceloma murrayae TaxID=2082308 RepID=A0A2K1QSE6_9PEZI|nr:hypothetical protein CAC42_3188 [Sphaceloma murrayae]
MSDNNNQNSNPSPTPPTARRTSFTSQALADIFGGNRSRPSFGADQNREQTNGTSTFPGPITSAAAQASRRRMSMTALGINGGNTQLTPPNNFKRSDSVSSHNSGSIDESAVEDGDPMSQSSPTTPFARRMSFGARALRDVRTGTGAGTAPGRSSFADTSVSSGTGSEQKKTTTPTPKARGPSSSSEPRTDCPDHAELKHRSSYLDSIALTASTDNGYNWADSFRSRAERSSSIVSSGTPPNINHTRAKSIATMQPPPVQSESPKPMVPDHMQERILKGDFYMD